MKVASNMTRKLISEKEFIVKAEKYLNFEITEKSDEVSKVIIIDQVCEPGKRGSWTGQFLGGKIMIYGEPVKFLAFIKYDADIGLISNY